MIEGAMVKHSREHDGGTASLAPEDLDRIMAAAFERVPAPLDADPDRPIIDDARIEVFELLGHGGLGAVYRCHDRRMKRDVALKVLRARHTGNLAARDGLLWEARLGARLDHPGIVPVHEIGVDATGRPYFTMRVVRGETLRAVLLTERTGEAGRARLLRVLLQVAEAVAHAHRAGIVHSDLKPENVMVGPNGEVLVLDWGLARSLEAKDDTRPSGSSSKAGTPAYMAPERGMSPPPPIAPAIDVFGLGVILLEVLTGPEAAATTASTSVPPGSGAALALRLDDSHPADLAALARDSVGSQPDARPTDGGAFAARLSASLGRLDEDARQARLDAAAADARATAERRARRIVQRLSLALLIAGVLAGALWLRAQRVHEQRRAGQAQLIQDALDDSRKLTAGLHFGSAVEPLREATELLARAARGLDADLVPPEWAARLDAEQVTVSQQLAKAEADATERRWRLDLETSLEASLLRGFSGLLSPQLAQAIAAALESAGMNPRAHTLAELGVPYPLGAECVALVDALDIWAMFGHGAEAPDAGTEAQRLRALAQELDPDSNRRAVRAAIMAGDRAAIERFIPTRISPHFQSATTYVMLGMSLRDDDISRAQSVWREGCFAFPSDPWCHVLLGDDWEWIGLERAREHTWAAIALEPRNHKAWTNLAVQYQASGWVDDALRAFRHVAEVLKPEADAYLNNYWDRCWKQSVSMMRLRSRDGGFHCIQRI
jgi:tetratricopeptide (TPR) repeat protein